MTSFDVDQALVVLNVPPTLEEPVVDWLLSRDDGTGFTGFAVSGHSTRHDRMSVAEQVSGRQRRQQFQVQMAADRVGRFLEEAGEEFGAAGIHYWVVPVMAAGHIGPPNDGGRTAGLTVSG